jgi:hypothetical protein
MSSQPSVPKDGPAPRAFGHNKPKEEDDTEANFGEKTEHAAQHEARDPSSALLSASGGLRVDQSFEPCSTRWVGVIWV